MVRGEMGGGRALGRGSLMLVASWLGLFVCAARYINGDAETSWEKASEFEYNCYLNSNSEKDNNKYLTSTKG